MQMKIDELLGIAINEGAVRGVTALVCNSEGIIYEGGAGSANGHGMHTNTVCTIYSMTKPVTAAAAMQLVEQGKLSLDAPAGDVCPYLHEVQVFEGYAGDMNEHQNQCKIEFKIQESISSLIDGIETKDDEEIIGALRWAIVETIEENPKFIHQFFWHLDLGLLVMLLLIRM